VQSFLSRALEGVWPYVWLDATYLKVRDGARVKSKALVVAVGVNGEGRREMLGPALGVAETEAFWTEFLCELNARGLRGVSLVISDAHSGLKTAAAKTLGATWQRCRVHFMRNALAYVPRKQHQMVAAAIRTPVRAGKPGRGESAAARNYGQATHALCQTLGADG